MPTTCPIVFPRLTTDEFAAFASHTEVARLADAVCFGLLNSGKKI
jgi:hypothetical protein